METVDSVTKLEASLERLKSNTQEALPSDLKLTGVFQMVAKKIEGTDMCELQVPCKYSGKKVAVFIYQSAKELQ